MTANVQFSLFTKSWKTLSVWELGRLVSELGFDGIEFPLRDGYQLEPDQAEKLPKLVQQLGDHGLKIFSVASSTNERVFAGCAEAGIPIIRIIPEFTLAEGYLKSEQRERRRLESLLPLCEKYGVRIGVQQHYGDSIIDSMGLLHFIDGFDPKYIGAIWDCAHDILAGQKPEFGLDIVWSHLCMVNLKNVYYKRLSQTNSHEEAEWELHITSAREGLASWARSIAYLKQRNYSGIVCLAAGYTDGKEEERTIREDLAYAKSLFSRR
jgi:sugar phosphate isomerase/epimerase